MSRPYGTATLRQKKRRFVRDGVVTHVPARALPVLDRTLRYLVSRHGIDRARLLPAETCPAGTTPSASFRPWTVSCGACSAHTVPTVLGRDLLSRHGAGRSRLLPAEACPAGTTPSASFRPWTVSCGACSAGTEPIVLVRSRPARHRLLPSGPGPCLAVPAQHTRYRPCSAETCSAGTVPALLVGSRPRLHPQITPPSAENCSRSRSASISSGTGPPRFFRRRQ